MENRQTHGEFAATKEYSDERFKNYFRLDRKQFHSKYFASVSFLSNQHGTCHIKPVCAVLHCEPIHGSQKQVLPCPARLNVRAA
jgi:hypothetical protein